MARLARVVALDTPHHITQRGNGRQYILESDTDRLVYLDLLRKHCRLHRLSLLGYCLMSNHVHLIAVPERDDSLRLALKHTHGRYAAYFNARCASSGHVWQGRYYSCPLDLPHLWAALRYTELNPVTKPTARRAITPRTIIPTAASSTSPTGCSIVSSAASIRSAATRAWRPPGSS